MTLPVISQISSQPPNFCAFFFQELGAEVFKSMMCMYVCMYAHKRLSSQMSEINVLESNQCSSTLVVGTTSGCSETLYPKQEGVG